MSVTISNPVRNYTDFDPDDLTQEEFEDIASRIIDTYQLGEKESLIDFRLCTLIFTLVILRGGHGGRPLRPGFGSRHGL